MRRSTGIILCVIGYALIVFGVVCLILSQTSI